MASTLGSQPVYVLAYDDLPQAGGALLGVVGPWLALSDTRRTDGDDRLEGTLKTNAIGASSVTKGICLQVTTPDGVVTEWIVQQVRDDLATDRLTVTALAARVWLAENVLVRSGTDITLSGSGAVTAVVDVLIATTEWPSWVIRGTTSIDPTISYSWSSSNGLAAVLAITAAVDDSEDAALAGSTVRFAFRRVSASQYAIDLLTTVVTGSPTLIQGKNITSFAIRDDRTQQATAIYPVNASGAGISEAMFAVRTVSTNTFDVRDWAYRDDFLAIAFDDQWVGYYAIAPDGSASVITDSSASLQQITVASATAWGTGNNATVRFAPTSSVDYTLAVVDTAAMGRKNVMLPNGSWSAKINWLPNSRWDEWSSSTVIRDWATAGGLTSNRDTTVGNVETGTYSIELVTGGSTGQVTVSEILMPDEVVTNNGGTQTWRVGVRSKMTVTTGGAISLQVTKDGGATWTAASINVVLGPAGTWYTTEATFTTNTATLNNRPRCRFAQTNTVAGTKVIIDRVWLFRDGVEDDDNTYVGNGPSVGFYAAQRALLRARVDGRSYEIGVADRTRDNPTAFPSDALSPAMTARVIVPSRSVDVSQTIAEVKRDLLQPLQTTISVGALKRRLTRIVT